MVNKWPSGPWRLVVATSAILSVAPASGEVDTEADAGATCLWDYPNPWYAYVANANAAALGDHSDLLGHYWVQGTAGSGSATDEADWPLDVYAEIDLEEVGIAPHGAIIFAEARAHARALGQEELKIDDGSVQCNDPDWAGSGGSEAAPDVRWELDCPWTATQRHAVATIHWSDVGDNSGNHAFLLWEDAGGPSLFGWEEVVTVQDPDDMPSVSTLPADATAWRRGTVSFTEHACLAVLCPMAAA